MEQGDGKVEDIVPRIVAGARRPAKVIEAPINRILQTQLLDIGEDKRNPCRGHGDLRALLRGIGPIRTKARRKLLVGAIPQM